MLKAKNTAHACELGRRESLVFLFTKIRESWRARDFHLDDTE